MGSTDRLIRSLIAIGLLMLCLANVVTGILATVLIVIAAIFLLTSLISVCPMYNLFGISTCRKHRQSGAGKQGA